MNNTVATSNRKSKTLMAMTIAAVISSGVGVGVTGLSAATGVTAKQLSSNKAGVHAYGRSLSSAQVESNLR